MNPFNPFNPHEVLMHTTEEGLRERLEELYTLQPQVQDEQARIDHIAYLETALATHVRVRENHSFLYIDQEDIAYNNDSRMRSDETNNGDSGIGSYALDNDDKIIGSEDVAYCYPPDEPEVYEAGVYEAELVAPNDVLIYYPGGFANNFISPTTSTATPVAAVASSSTSPFTVTPSNPVPSNQGHRNPNDLNDWLTSAPAKLKHTKKKEYMQGKCTVNGHLATNQCLNHPNERPCVQCRRAQDRDKSISCDRLTSDPAVVFPRPRKPITPQSPYHRCSNCVGLNVSCEWE